MDMVCTDSFVLCAGQLAVMSAFLGPDQTATETLLAADPDVAPWVQKYQRSRETVSQTDYEVTLYIHTPSFLGKKKSYSSKLLSQSSY